MAPPEVINAVRGLPARCVRCGVRVELLNEVQLSKSSFEVTATGPLAWFDESTGKKHVCKP